MDQKKVLLLTHEYPPFHGGIGTYTHDVARAMVRLGREVEVWAPDFGGPQDALDAGPVRHRRFPGGIFKKHQFPNVVMTARRALAEPNTQIIAADWPFVAAFALLRRFRRFTYASMLHGSEILFFRQQPLIHLGFGGDPFHGADPICVNSAYTGRLLAENYPEVAKRRVVVTYLGVDPFWTEPTPRDDGLLARLGVPAGRVVVLSVGRLHSRKGQDKCIAALSAMPADLRARIAYVVVGSGQDAAYNTALADAAGAADFPVILAGGLPQDDLRRLYASSDLFALAAEPKGTKVEGFGLVFLEAASLGVPSVSIRAAAVPEVVLDGRTGLLAEPGDLGSLTSAFAALIADGDRRRAMGEAARAWAAEFTWEKTARQTLDAFPDEAALRLRSVAAG